MATRDGLKTGGRAKGTPNKARAKRPPARAVSVRVPLAGLRGPAKPGWLLIVTGAVLVSPFPVRPDGPTVEELDSIMAMQRRLRQTPATVWMDDESGRVAAYALAADELSSKAARLVTCRLRDYGAAA